MRFRQLMPLSLLVVALPAFADLYVSPVVRDTIEQDATAVAPYPAAISSVVADEPAAPAAPADPNLMRYGSNIPLFVALDHIVPDADNWRVHLDEGLENRIISWEGGDSWEGVLTAIAEQNGLSIVMNHRDKVVGVAEAETMARPLANNEPEVWRLVPGQTLKENLQAWANQAGWELSWGEELRIDYPINHKATLLGPFDGPGGVVDRLLAAFKDQPKPLTATFYSQNKVMRITEAGYRQEVQ